MSVSLLEEVLVAECDGREGEFGFVGDVDVDRLGMPQELNEVVKDDVEQHADSRQDDQRPDDPG